MHTYGCTWLWREPWRVNLGRLQNNCLFFSQSPPFPLHLISTSVYLQSCCIISFLDYFLTLHELIVCWPLTVYLALCWVVSIHYLPLSFGTWVFQPGYYWQVRQDYYSLLGWGEWRHYPEQCNIFSSIPSLYPLDVSSISHSQSKWSKYLQTLYMSTGVKIALSENHCCRTVLFRGWSAYQWVLQTTCPLQRDDYIS